MNMLGIKILEERKSEYNGKICVVNSLGLGTYIQVEGLTQSGGLVYEVWENTLRRVKRKRQEINNCLILGLGGGSAARLVRKYWPEAKITGVDIDPVMVELGEKYLGLDKAQVEVQVQDALKFVNNYPLSAVRYDLVIVDLYVYDKVPAKFETDDFINLILKLQSKGGIVIFNRLYYGEKRPQAMRFLSKLEKVFAKVNPVYPQANLMLLCYNR